MRIAIVAHGRFSAFDLARALLRRGHQVQVFTNYPARAVEKFGIPRTQVTSFPAHGILSRAAWKLRGRFPALYPEGALHQLFGAWAADVLRRQAWEVVHPFSGIAQELLERRQVGTFYLLHRGSAHIRTQAALLRQEEARTGTKQDKPSSWMLAREEREYALADQILTISTFARRTFLECGVAPGRLVCVPLAANPDEFRPDRATIDVRLARIRRGEPLRVLFVGTLSYRKGMFDLVRVARALPRERFVIRCVGPRLAETNAMINSLRDRIEWVPKVPQSELRAQYDWGDIYILPTIEDGFAITLAQARANALPILSTYNCGAPDLIQDGITGWLVPIRSPEKLRERLLACDEQRAELAAMVQRSYTEFQPRTWGDVAREFEQVCERARGEAA